ncbi:DNA starvation/stationary phase protection protein Dps [Halioxenophilus aromaticivorans]|uniref:DNA starvation/stationary phase protection protein n=1 Tax=Halioxenophilus aromaticivorans TaxID=1306992 RepID=A0AAV3U6C1_9ALTE
MSNTKFTVPGVSQETGEQIISIMHNRLIALLDLQLTLKHVHWNVVGRHFIGVHEMLDPQVDGVRAMTDALAERIAALGGTPCGTPGAIVEKRSWEDYKLGKATVTDHLVALDAVYTGVNEDHRKAVGQLGEIDPVSEDMIIAQLGELEQYQWFVRAHLESSDGELSK